MSRTPDVLLSFLGIASIVSMVACSREQERPVVPTATLAPTPTYTSGQAEKRRLGQDLEAMDLSGFVGFGIPENGSAIMIDDTVLANFSKKYFLILNRYNLRYWLARCGIGQLNPYELSIVMQDVNPNGRELQVNSARNEGEVGVDVDSLVRRVIGDFDNQVTVSSQSRARVLNSYVQVQLSTALAQGICGAVEGSKALTGRPGVSLQEVDAAANKAMDEVGSQAEGFVKGNLPLIAVVRWAIGTSY